MKRRNLHTLPSSFVVPLLVSASLIEANRPSISLVKASVALGCSPHPFYKEFLALDVVCINNKCLSHILNESFQCTNHDFLVGHYVILLFFLCKMLFQFISVYFNFLLNVYLLVLSCSDLDNLKED